MKVTKRERKKINGMNAITRIHAARGFSAPKFTGNEAVTLADGKVLLPFSKIQNGTPSVNPNNFN